jgi:hypothetical protein
MSQFLSLPFTIPDVYEGLAAAHGIARSSEAGLILEFQVKDGFVGMVKSRVTEVTIPFNEIISIELKEGWFKRRLFIRARSLATVTNVPGNHAGQVALKIARSDLRMAREMVSVLRLTLSERELQSVSAVTQHDSISQARPSRLGS